MSEPAYISGDFWRICDRCGFKKRASQTYRTWDGLYVCSEDFETRHPQDFVRGRVDNQVVPNPRPETIDNLSGPLMTHLSSAAVLGATTLSVDSSIRFMSLDTIGVMLDSGENERHTVLSIPDGTSLRLTAGLGRPAASGNVVINYSAVASVDIG